jgi:predicted esterase
VAGCDIAPPAPAGGIHAGVTVREHVLRTPRTARYYTVGGPSPRTREVWIVCHGYAQLARYFISAFEPIDDGTRLIVAPEALNRYYFETAPGVHGRDARVAATWMTREHREHEIADYVDYLDNLAEHIATGVALPTRLIALGFSQGAATVSRWAARGHTPIDHVVLWGSSIARELEPDLDLFRGAALTIAIGNEDEHVTEARVGAEDARLRSAGMDYRLMRYDGGHRVEPAALRALVRDGL